MSKTQSFGEAMIAMEKGKYCHTVGASQRYRVLCNVLKFEGQNYGWHTCGTALSHLMELRWEIYKEPKPKKKITLHEAVVKCSSGYYHEWVTEDYYTPSDTYYWLGNTREIEVDDEN